MTDAPTILVIDNYDSFVYILVQYLGELGAQPVVRRHDEIDLDGIRELDPDGILISPGPGNPDDSGVSMDLLAELGGIRLLDDGEADDKIVAVLDSDTVFDYARDIRHLPEAVTNRLVHYFATYKMQMTGEQENSMEIVGTYGRDEALEVITASMADYVDHFSVPGRHNDG